MPDLLIQLGWLIVATIIVGLAFNWLEYGRVQSLKLAQSIRISRDVVHALIYLCTYIVTTAAIIVALFSDVAVVRWIALMWIFFALAGEYFGRFVMGENLGFNEVQSALAESTFAGQFVSSHGGSLLRAFACAAIVTAAFFAAAHFVPLRFESWWLVLVPLAFIMAYAVIWRTVAATDVFPSPIRVPVLFAYVYLNALRYRPRQAVELTPQSDTKPRCILLIMDESITGRYLTINGWQKHETTPYLESIAEQYHNLGIACAASNISAATNLVIRSGLRVDQLPDREQRGLSQPSLFQYAQNAGYRTCYLDAQYAPGVKGNFLSDHDLANIDEVYWAIGDEPDLTKRYRRDRLLLERILALLENDEPTFIWVNKYGAHIHFDQTYPPDARIFEPMMPPGRSLSACSLEEIENSYANAIRWSVDEFFKSLVPALDLANTAIVYTSDHGQSIEARHGSSTHADRLDPPVVQANVPMLCWGEPLREHFNAGLGAIHDRTSHFQIFPTLLTAMGYEEAEMMERYGAPLWSSPPDRRVFLSGDVFGRGIVHINTFDAADQPMVAAAK